MTESDDCLPIPGDVLERVTAGVVALDSDLRYTYANRRATSILGRPSGELVGQHVWEVFPGGAGTVAQKKIEQALLTQQPCAFERYDADTGRWWSVHVYPGPEGVSLCFTDDTERTRADRRLTQNTDQLTALIENTDEAVYVKDCDGHYELMNAAAASFFGLVPDEVPGLHDRDLFDAESTNRIREVERRIIETGEADQREAVRYIDGRRYVLLDNKYPYRDENGEIVGIMGISRDITARKQREQTREALTEEYEALLATAGDSIFLIDVDGTQDAPDFRFARLNAAHEAATGLRSDAVRGRTPREVLGADLGAEVARNYRRCVWARRPISYEESLALPEGTRVWQTHLAPVILDGQVTRIVGIARDISERVAREDELRRKNDRLDEFASVVSHDLRNPLHVAKERTALAQEEADLRHLETVELALERMDAIIADTLTLARQGDRVSDPVPIQMNVLAAECWEMVHTAEATLDLRASFVIEGDPGRLLHVLENLYRNAVEHGGASVVVRVGPSPAGFFVEDDGPGIPFEKRDAVFAPGHSSASGGTGFGLTIVRRIAEAHGWTVAVTEGTDGGARFEFSDVTGGPIEDE
jgi:PAS domain S-box-containing protein